MSTHLHLEVGDERDTLLISDVDARLPLSEVLARRGTPLNTRCGGTGRCGGCAAHLRGGPLLDLVDGSRVEPAEGLRTCLYSLPPEGEVTLTVPERSLLRHEPAVVDAFKIRVPWGQDPLAAQTGIGAAVDIGTTTVALLLSDLETGKVLAKASAFNAQIRHGEDVLTRIQACHENEAALRDLQQAVVAETLQPLLATACAEADIAPAEVGVMTIAANTTMLHLLAGVDPSPLGVHPFTPEFLEHREYPANELGLALGDGSAPVHLLPGLAAYVGADLTAGLIATGMLYDEGPTLLVDVGTNGEIIAQVGDRLVGCATAAGPAFEGAGLSSGTRGVTGAIERITADATTRELALEIIGDVPRPLGICGSAYVDFLGEGRRAGLLAESGRFAPDFIRAAGNRVESNEYGKKLCVHPRGANGPVWISEVDIASLLQAKAAIGAGIEILLDRLGVAASEVKTVYLAGGFGLHLSLENAIGCGLLPGFRPEQIEVVGNTAMAGAYLALNDRSLLAEMETARQRMETIELNLEPDFEDTYIDHLMLP